MRHFVITSGVIFVLGASSWALFHEKEAPRHAAKPTTGEQSERLELRPTGPAMAAADMAVSTHPAPPPRASTADTAVDAPPSAEAPLQRLFKGDQAPTADSWKYRSAVKDALERVPGSTVALDSLECRFRVCRLSLTLQNHQADTQIFNNVFRKGTTDAYPNGFGAISVPVRRELPDGRTVATVYMA